MKRSSFVKLFGGALFFKFDPFLRGENGSLSAESSFEGKVVKSLQRAFTDEWFAYYQYYVEYSEVEGKLKKEAIFELKEHAEDELRHAGIVRDRIHELGGRIVLSPKDWYDYSTCGYLRPKKFDVAHILDDAIEGERCAIKVYKGIADFTKGKDEKTYKLVMQILEEEKEHEEDLLKVKASLK